MLGFVGVTATGRPLRRAKCWQCWRFQGSGPSSEKPLVVNWGGVMDQGTAAANIAGIQDRIDRARKRFGPPPGAVTLVAVSKTFDADAVRPFLSAGHRVFGENRVQEAAAKWPALRAEYPAAELHLIGPLQTNKV